MWQEKLASHLVILNCNSLSQQHFRQCCNGYRFQYLPIFHFSFVFTRYIHRTQTSVCPTISKNDSFASGICFANVFKCEKNPNSNHSASKNPIDWSVTQFLRENTLLALLRFTKSTFRINLFLQCVFPFSDVLKAVNVSRDV